jgi:Transposase DDE domain group 1
LIVRRERPHPGAQLSVFDCETGYRHTAFITDQAEEDVAALELRHRHRARVEDAIRVGKETGMRKMPFSAFAHNEAWLEVSLLAQPLLRWTALLCLEGTLALAEPKRVRQRLLHVAGRLVRSGRRVALRLPRSWPWAEALMAAFARLRVLPPASP